MQVRNATQRSGKTQTAVIAGVVLVAALGWIIYHWVGGSSAPTPEKAVSIAEPFLSEIRNGQVDAAWESTGAEFKSLMGKEEFKKFVKEQPILKDQLQLGNVQQVTINKMQCLQCAFHKPSAEGNKLENKLKVRVLIAQEPSGPWKVGRLIVDPK